MTQEDKELLLKDLCARLPYGVKYYCSDIKNVWKLNAILTKRQDDDVFLDIYNLLDLCKPYLFPLSSIKEEQWRELFEIAGYEVREEDCGRHTEMYYYDMVGHNNTLYPNCDDIDWLNAHHFDYRGLIEKGLAIDATGLNIY